MPHSTRSRSFSDRVLGRTIPPVSKWEVHILAPYAFPEDTLSADSQQYWHGTHPSNPDVQIVTEWPPQHESELIKQIQDIGVKSVKWHVITLRTFEKVLDQIPTRAQNANTICFSLLDGSETDGFPGVSVLRALESRGHRFTGSDSYFFNLDTIKADMKKALVDCKAMTPGFFDMTDRSLEQKPSVEWMRNNLKFPVLVKPSASSGSRGLTDKSVCHTAEEAWEQALVTREEYKGAYAEEFISGREFTALLCGDANTGVRTFAAAERVFRKNLPKESQFLSWEMKWKEWGESARDPNAHWWYAAAPEADQAAIQAAAADVYKAVGGNGFARLDLRMDERDGKLYAVDVNANCSIDVDPNTAMGLILSMEKLNVKQLMSIFLEYAFRRGQHNFSDEEVESDDVADEQEYITAAGNENKAKQSTALKANVDAQNNIASALSGVSIKQT